MVTAAARRIPVPAAREEIGRAPPRIPPLENGDRLTREEFERRVDAIPGLQKAELIAGVVHMPSPVRHRDHGRQHGQFARWLLHYEAGTPGVQFGLESSLRLEDDNEPQPDGFLFIEPECGGQVYQDEEGYLVGGPDLVGEVSATTASIDLNAKFTMYRRNRVREYVVWRVLDGAIDWFTRQRGQFRRLQPGRDGISRSRVFPGLWLDPDALLRRDVPRLLQVLDEGLASTAHAAFVERLRSRRARREQDE